MKMSKKNYIEVADILARNRMVMRSDDWVTLMNYYSNLFKFNNRAFDRDRFREACYK